MLINPLIILLTLALIVIIMMVCIVKNPRFPIMTVACILIFAVYLGLAYSINGGMYSVTEFVLPKSILSWVISFATTESEPSYTCLEQAFYQFSIALMAVGGLTLIALVIDIRRIFFGKSKD